MLRKKGAAYPRRLPLNVVPYRPSAVIGLRFRVLGIYDGVGKQIQTRCRGICLGSDTGLFLSSGLFDVVEYLDDAGVSIVSQITPLQAPSRRCLQKREEKQVDNGRAYQNTCPHFSLR